TRANTSGTGGNYLGQQRVVKCFNCQGEGYMARQCPKSKRKRDASWYRENVLLVEAQRNGKVLNEEELEFLADPSIAEAKVVLMANLSSYGSDVLYEVPYFDNTNNDMLNQSVQEMPYSKPSYFVEHPENEIHSDSNIISYSQYLIELQNAAVQDTNSSAQQDALILSVFEQLSNQVTNCNKVNNDNQISNESLSADLERYKEHVKLLEERQNMDLCTREKLIINDIIQDKDVPFADFEKEINSLNQTLSEQLKEEESLTKTFNVFKMNQRKKKLGILIKRLLWKRKLKNWTIFELNRLSVDFGKCFVPQRELSDEQALHPITDQSASSPVKIEAPRELPKMEVVVQQYHIDKQCFEIQKKQFLLENDRLLDQIISQDIVNIVVNSYVDVNNSVKVNSSVVMNDSKNYMEMCNKCLELEAELIKQHNMVEKDEYNRLLNRFSELEQHCISLEIAMQLNKEIFQKHNTSMNQTEPLFNQFFKLNNLKAELQEKDTTIKKLKAQIKRVNETFTSESVKKDLDEIKTINIELEHREKVFVITALKNDLRKLKGKDIVDNATKMSNAATFAPGMYKLDPVILAPKVKNNREAHEYYLKHTMEQAAILREVVEQAKSRNPLDSATYSACMVKCSTSASGSKPLGNTKNDRISRTPSSNEKNKVEVQSRKVKSKLNEQNFDSKNVYNKHVKHPVKGAQALCSICNECLFDANHAMCLIDYVNSMNVTFTLVGNACPLTRITVTNKVPLRVPISLEVVTPEHVVTRVYTRRPKVPKFVPNSKPKVTKSMTANRMEPGTSWGFDNLVASSSSSLIDCRLSKLFCGIWTPAAPST
ncbi:retrovirus-related pol polyprotein from transposon TNT 1-94, partial [Tanacetum coccineum]